MASSSSSENDSILSTTSTDIHVAVDLGYDWPKEKKPAKERQGGVVKQLSNFAEQFDRWKFNYPPVLCCGKGVAEIQDRINHLGPLVRCDNIDIFDMSGFSLIYLSPDANEYLDISKGFPIKENGSGEPIVFIVGGLIDRKVKRGRSQIRAESKNIPSYQLPLEEYNGEPMNIDTILAILYYWKAFDSKYTEKIQPDSPSDSDENSDSLSLSHLSINKSLSHEVEDRSESFRAARHCAIYEHKKRHPNQGAHTL